MAQDDAKRQRRLQKQKAKRKEKRKEFIRRNASGLSLRLSNAAEWPIIEALEPPTLWEGGMGHLILARRTPEGRIAWASYLIDVWCLGIKNVMCAIDSSSEYASMRQKLMSNQRMSPVAPERVAKIVRDAVAYAGALGFHPPSDFPEARLLLAGIDPATCPDTLNFGQNGKPYYVRGPFENLARAAAIGARVKAAGGDYIVPLGDMGFSQGMLGGEPFRYDEDEDEDEDG